MKLLIHGATNGTNYGDCLFAKLFYSTLGEKYGYNNVGFLKAPMYGICKELIDELKKDNNDVKLFSMFNADCLVYMSGGYFGDTLGGKRESIKRYFRYFLLGDIFRLMRKPIYICGVGGGPIESSWLRNRIVKIMNYAENITVRDAETADYYRNHGVFRSISVNTDTALMLSDYTPTNEIKISPKKKILLHVYGNDNSNKEIETIIVPALNRYIKKHNNFIVILATDCVTKNNIENLSIYSKIEGEKIAVNYSTVNSMNNLLASIDCAITVKLHVGIVSSVFGKSVLSFPKHKVKTKRFYHQIGQDHRCVQLTEATEKIVFDMLENYVDEQIIIPKEVLTKARKNIESVSVPLKNAMKSRRI